MKKAKSIVILLTVLLILLLVYFVVSPRWSEKATEDTTAEPTYQIAAIDHSSLVGLELTRGDVKLSFTLNDTATEWDWSDNAEIPLDNMTFATIVTALNNASSKYKLEGVTAEQLAVLSAPMELDGYRLQPVKIKRLAPTQLEMTLFEGRNRQIRRMCEAVGFPVIRLKRVEIGGVSLGNLPEGKWRHLRNAEIDLLMKKSR